MPEVGQANFGKQPRSDLRQQREQVLAYAHKIEEEARALAFENERLRAELDSCGLVLDEMNQRNLEQMQEIKRFANEKRIEVEDPLVGDGRIWYLRSKFVEAQTAVEHDLGKILETIAKTDPDDNSEVAELIRCHLDRWAHWGPSRLHIGLGKV